MFGELISITPNTTPPHAHIRQSAVFTCTRSGVGEGDGGRGSSFVFAEARAAGGLPPAGSAASPRHSPRRSRAEKAV